MCVIDPCGYIECELFLYISIYQYNKILLKTYIYIYIYIYKNPKNKEIINCKKNILKIQTINLNNYM